jgi:hypothetical protein
MISENQRSWKIKSLSLNKLLPLIPPLKKGDIGGFALARFGKISPTPLYKGGNIVYGQALNLKNQEKRRKR